MEQERAVVLNDWPQPGTVGGVALEVGDHRELVIRYDTFDRGRDVGAWAPESTLECVVKGGGPA